MPTSIVVLQKDPQKFEILWVWLFMPCSKGKVVIQTCYMKISIVRCLLSKGKQPNADFVLLLGKGCHFDGVSPTDCYMSLTGKRGYDMSVLL